MTPTNGSGQTPSQNSGQAPSQQAPSQQAPYQPLAGVRFLDLTGQYAGSQITRVMADLGAQVIKVEAPNHIDMVSRGLIPTDNIPTNHWWRRAAYWAERNINKLGITIDLNHEEGKQVFYDLLDISDVVSDNFTPRVMRHFGFEYDSLKEIKPDIIRFSLSGYGQAGPLGNAPANAFGMLAAAGLATTMGFPSDEPYLPTTSLADMYGGISSVGAILVALRRRNIARAAGNAVPERIDMAGREAGMPMVASFTLHAQRSSEPSEVGEPIYRTVILGCRGDESWLVVSYRDAEEWTKLCTALAVADPPPPPDNPSGDPASVPAVVTEAARNADAHAVAHALQAQGVAAGPCQNGRDILLDAHLREREAFTLCHHPDPEIGPRPYGRAFPVRVLGAAPVELRDPPLQLGRDNRFVMRELLGYSDERIAELYELGVAGDAPSTRFGPAWATPLDTDSMVEDGGALRAPDYLDVLSERFGTRVGPSVAPQDD